MELFMDGVQGKFYMGYAAVTHNTRPSRQTSKSEPNGTRVTEFLLLGFPQIKGYKTYLVFFSILSAYIITLAINLLIIVLVSTKRKLSSPMYFFIQQLSIVEIVFLSIIVPNMLYVIWMEGATIPISNCITQTYIYCALGCAECHLLAIMSYDRYLAICHPLHYSAIMNVKHQRILIIYCWVFSFLLTQITLNILCQLQFCGPNVIDHFFCDLVPYVELTCYLSFGLQLEILIVSIPLMVIPFILVTVSYICVFKAILAISSTAGRKKAFSTCGSHLIVVSMFYGAMMTIYVVPANGSTLPINKLLSLLYVVTTICSQSSDCRAAELAPGQVVNGAVTAKPPG
ncbi:olfactory receptor 11A1-like [Gastrophryne carolinensis]